MEPTLLSPKITNRKTRNTWNTDIETKERRRDWKHAVMVKIWSWLQRIWRGTKKVFWIPIWSYFKGLQMLRPLGVFSTWFRSAGFGDVWNMCFSNHIVLVVPTWYLRLHICIQKWTICLCTVSQIWHLSVSSGPCDQRFVNQVFRPRMHHYMNITHFNINMFTLWFRQQTLHVIIYVPYRCVRICRDLESHFNLANVVGMVLRVGDASGATMEDTIEVY